MPRRGDRLRGVSAAEDQPVDPAAGQGTGGPGSGRGAGSGGGERAGDGASASPSPQRPQRHWKVWQETLVLLVVAVVLSVLVKTFLVQAFYIPSSSMEPGLQVNDRIMVQKVSYWGGEPTRGDVVVFEDPGGWLPDYDSGPSGALPTVLSKVGLYPTGGHLVKRVVGTAGDVITCCDSQGRLMVNGEPVEESQYARPDESGCFGPMPGECSWTVGPVPDGYLFVMGDNRASSSDSSARLCTERETDCVPGREFVPADLVVGKVFVRVWPAKRFGGVDASQPLRDAPGPQ